MAAIGSNADELERNYPTPPQTEQPPVLPRRLRDVSSEDLRDLLCAFTGYFSHLDAKAARAKCDLSDVQARLDGLTYALRNEVRGLGYDRDERKEVVETDPRINDQTVAIQNYTREYEHFASLTRGAKAAIRAIDEELFARRQGGGRPAPQPRAPTQTPRNDIGNSRRVARK